MPGIKTKIVVVEPDAKSLRDLEAELSTYYYVVGVLQMDRAASVLKAERDAKAVIVSTVKGADVIGLFNALRREFPQILRVLLTEFEDLTQIVEGLHSGAVHRVVSKPLQYAEMLGSVPTAASHGTQFGHVA